MAKTRVKTNLEDIKKIRDLAISWRKNTGWDARLERSLNYYQYGMDEDLRESVSLTKKKKRRKANYVFSNIESMIPKMFDRLPSFQVIGRGEEDYEKAPLLEDILRYKVGRLNLEERLEDMVRNMLVKSIGYLKVVWDIKTEKGEDEDKLLTDDVKVSIVQPEHFWITAGDVRLEEADGFFERMLISPEACKAKYGKELKPNAYLIDNELKKEEEGRVIVWEYWDRGKKKVYTFTDKDILDTRDWYEHGKSPYVELPNFRRSDEFYPWSETYQMEPLQDELLEIDNQASEFRKRAINPKKVIQKGVVDDTNMARLKDPRINVVEATDINGIKWEQPSMIGPDIYNFRNIKKEDISLMTGQNEISRGGVEKSVRTATGQQILFDAAQGRIRQKVRAMERAIKELLILIQGLLAQFQDKEEQVKISDSQEESPFKKYTNEDVQGNFDYIIDIVETMPFFRERRAQLALQAYQMFAQDPDFDSKALKKKVIKLAFQDINAEELLLPEEAQEEMPEEMPIDQYSQMSAPNIPETGMPQTMGEQMAPTGQSL